MATAVQISQRIGPLQTRNAAGTGNGNHGKTMNASSQIGASEAPARAKPATAAPAASAVTHANGETGRSPMREPSRLETASVPCDSHAAAVVTSAAAAKPERVM